MIATAIALTVTGLGLVVCALETIVMAVLTRRVKPYRAKKGHTYCG